MDNLTIFENADDPEIAGWIARALGEALSATPAPIAICVPGGTTPFPILELLRKMPLEWSRVTVWPGDDRVVAEDHSASNTGRIRALLEPAGAEVVTLTEMEAVPRFALAWLGMGEDGHVASLFPNTDPRIDDPECIRRLTLDPLPPEAPFDRISLTLPALLNSDRLLFVIRGKGKRSVFEAALQGAHDLPIARLLAAARQPVVCFA
jgi:6-phosphogluconolactonase